jgi:hypothetical protein
VYIKLSFIAFWENNNINYHTIKSSKTQKIILRVLKIPICHCSSNIHFLSNILVPVANDEFKDKSKKYNPVLTGHWKLGWILFRIGCRSFGRLPNAAQNFFIVVLPNLLQFFPFRVHVLMNIVIWKEKHMNTTNFSYL